MLDKYDIKISREIIMCGLLDEYRLKFHESEFMRKLYCVTLAMQETEACGACVVYDQNKRLIAETVIAKEYTVRAYRLARIVKEFWTENPGYGFIVAIPQGVSELYDCDHMQQIDWFFENMDIMERNYIFAKGASFETLCLNDDNISYR